MNIPQNLNPNRVVIALSGGVDSSVAAVLLQEAGYEVIGITLKLWDAPSDETYKHTSCCSVEDIGDARRVADQLKIPFYVVNSKENFKKNVVEKFAEAYSQGLTPNPCALCNEKVKFEFLLEKAFELGAYHVATGHFAQKIWNDEQKYWQFLKGEDDQKDQTYFLFSLGQEQLEHSLFPVGHLTKKDVRALAEKHQLKTRNKPESQEICFIPAGDHGAFIEKHFPEKAGNAGNFIDESGKVLGQHEGIHRYTIGQRRGTQVAQGERVYIQSINPEQNTVVLSANEKLFQSSLLAQRVRWVRPIESGSEITAKIRYRHEGSQAVVKFDRDNEVEVQFLEAQRAITPGQAVVFYQGRELLGGGWIARSLS